MAAAALPCNKTSTKQVTHCPAAHLLRPWEAQAGVCDGCSRKVMKGEHVMDCRQCDWYLCRTCRPPMPEDDSIWNTVTGIMDALAQDASDLASEMGIDSLLKSNNTILKDSKQVGQASEFDEEGVSDAEKAKAEKLVSDFCEKHPALRVEPNAEELAELCSALAELPEGPAARTFCEQLSWADSTEWQPKLRALHALEYLYWRGVMVHEKAAALIEHLEGVLQCKEQATRTLAVLSGEIQASASRWQQAPAKKAEEAAPKKAADLMSFDEPAKTRAYSVACGGA